MLNPKGIDKLNPSCYNQISNDPVEEIEYKIHTNLKSKKEAQVFFKALGTKNFREITKKQKLDPIPTSTHTPRTLSKMNNFSKYAVAAILLLSFLPLGYQFLSQTMSSEEIFAANFSTEKILDLKNKRSVENEGESKTKTPEDIERANNRLIQSKAIVSYNGKNYPKAINLFKTCLTFNTNLKEKEKINFYLGKSYLANNQPLEAKVIFKKIIKEGKKRIKQDADWYLVLTLIKESNVEQAQKELNKILLSETHAHKDKALKLQQQIDMYYVQ